MASSRDVLYLLPGGQAADFHEMCNIYMDKYFPKWKQNAETNVLPPLARCSPEPPIGASGGGKRTGTSDKKYQDFRTKQKADLDEMLLIRQVQKYHEEHQSKTFAFHQLQFHTKQWQWFKSMLEAEDKMQHWQSLCDAMGFDERWKLPKNFEIDLITVDDRCGVTLWEVKGRNMWTQQQAGHARIHHAAEQLKRDVGFLQWLARSVYEPASDRNRELVIRKVVVLPDDNIPPNESASFQNLRDYSVLTSDDLRSYDKFSDWHKQTFTVTEHSSYHYQQLVPLLVGIMSAVGAVGLVRQADRLSHMARVLQPSAAIAELDGEIEREQLARTEELFTDIERTKTTDVFRKAKSMKILFLTPSQQTIYRNSNEGLTVLEGPAGCGKSILTAFKVLELASKPDHAPILLLCRGAYAWHYKQLLSDNGVESQMALPVGEQEKSADSFFKSVLLCQAAVTDDRLKITLNLTVRDALPKVCIGQASDFLNAIQRLNRLATYEHQKAQKLTLIEVRNLQVSVVWKQTMHLIIDDADLVEVQYCKEILTQASAELTTWIAIDHNQMLSGCLNSDKIQDLMQQISTTTQSNVKWHRLAEILRNSAEICEFNKYVVAYISKSLSINSVKPELPIQGTNLHGPLVYFYELYDPLVQQERQLQPERSPGTQLMSKFVLFVFDKILDQNAKSQDVPILTAGLDPVIKLLVNCLRTREQRKMVGADLKNQYENEEFAAANVTVEYSAMTKSFEWERALIIAPWPVNENVRTQDEDYYHSVVLGCLQALYQATTRPRSQLYIVAPGQYFEKWLKLTCGVPDSCVVLHKFKKSQSGEFVIHADPDNP